MRWSPTRFYLFGTDSEEVDELDVDTFLDVVHPEDRERCLEAGMAAYLAKPVEMDALVEVFETVGDSSKASE